MAGRAAMQQPDAGDKHTNTQYDEIHRLYNELKEQYQILEQKNNTLRQDCALLQKTNDELLRELRGVSPPENRGPHFPCNIKLI